MRTTMLHEHTIGALAEWGTHMHNLRKCRILDYGPVQGTRMIRITDKPKGPHDYAKNKQLCVDIDDLWEREEFAK